MKHLMVFGWPNLSHPPSGESYEMGSSKGADTKASGGNSGAAKKAEYIHIRKGEHI